MEPSKETPKVTKHAVSRRDALKLLGSAAAMFALQAACRKAGFPPPGVEPPVPTEKPAVPGSELVSSQAVATLPNGETMSLEYDVYGRTEVFGRSAPINSRTELEAIHYWGNGQTFGQEKAAEMTSMGQQEIYTLQKEVLNPTERYYEILVPQSFYQEFEIKMQQVPENQRLGFIEWLQDHFIVMNKTLTDAGVNNLNQVLKRIVIIGDHYEGVETLEDYYATSLGWNLGERMGSHTFFPAPADSDVFWFWDPVYSDLTLTAESQEVYFNWIKQNFGQYGFGDLEDWRSSALIGSQFFIVNGKPVLIRIKDIHELFHSIGAREVIAKSDLQDFETVPPAAGSVKRIFGFENNIMGVGAGWGYGDILSPLNVFDLERAVACGARNYGQLPEGFFNEYPENLGIKLLKDGTGNILSVDSLAVDADSFGADKKRFIPLVVNSSEGSINLVYDDMVRCVAGHFIFFVAKEKEGKETFFPLPTHFFKMAKLLQESGSFSGLEVRLKDVDWQGAAFIDIEVAPLPLQMQEEERIYAQMELPGLGLVVYWRLLREDEHKEPPELSYEPGCGCSQ